MTAPAVVALDVGGTTLKGALVGAGGDPLLRRDVPTPAAAGGEAVTRAVLDLARSLAAAPGVRVVAAAAVTPGRVADGVVRYAANLGWRDVPLASALAAALGVPAAADNDVSAAALAESAVAPGGTDCLFVALGTGVGAGYVRDGAVLPGATGAAGELGHIPVYPDGEPCSCGQRGCLERYASASGVVRRYRTAGGASPDGGAGDGRGRDDVGGAGDVVARLGRDAVADRVWREAVEALALALATSTLLLDPAAVILGGGLARAGDALLEPLRQQLAARLTWRAAPPVTLSVLGNDAGWRGAALQAWRLVPGHGVPGPAVPARGAPVPGVPAGGVAR